MFCKHCGSQMDNNSLFCSHCGKSVWDNDAKKPANVHLHWILLTVSIGIVLLSLLLALDRGDKGEAKEVILPAILSLGAIGLSGYVFANTKNDKTKHTVSLLVLIASILMAFELCLGPLIGTLVS